MTNISGIPTTRVSSQWAQQRLLAQVQSSQQQLYRLQQQLSTGRRIELPSTDPVAAMQIVSLQRLLECKEQVQSNLGTTLSYLSMTDTALSSAAHLLADVRGDALTALGTTVTDEQRRAIAEQVEQAIRQLIDTGNQQYRGRYLFAGSNTLVRPFQLSDAQVIQYAGNEKQMLSYSDVDLLSVTNVPGSRVFGAISDPVRGTVDLEPVLTYDTRLSDLRGGRGITPGSIAISDGRHTSIVDLSSARSIGDVAALIRAHAPETRSLDVAITATGLVVQLDSAPGDLSIREVGGGTTAYELGILAEIGVGNNAIVGKDLDPTLQLTTRLDDILGVRSRAVVRSGGVDNDILLEADVRGPQLNGTTIVFVHDPTIAAGDEWVAYDPVAGAIEVGIHEGFTRAHQVVEAINAAHDLGALPFTARLDPLDARQGGVGFIPATPPGQVAGTTAGGSGTEFDRDSGLQIVNAGATHTISLTSATTVEDVLNILNGAGAGLLAEINRDGTGINVRSRASGDDFAIGENGGITATQLGLRTFTGQIRLDQLNFGLGVADSPGADFTITRADGVSFEIDVQGAQTIDDVLDRINFHPDNLAAGVPVAARLARVGNGIELVDETGGPGTLAVTRNASSLAAYHLGLIPAGQDGSSAPPAPPGEPQVLTARDVHLFETEGVFTALARLQQGLLANDAWTVERAVAMLDGAMLELNLTRAELGAREQGLDVLQTRIDQEQVELERVLSLEFDADMVEVVSKLSAQQVAYEASLIAISKVYQLSLINYL